MLLVKHCDITAITALLSRFQLQLSLTKPNTDIPGSFWGEDEAGLINNMLYVNPNTPIHSLLHEACHFICMDETRRKELDTNAGGDYDEENAVCYLQIILSQDIQEMGREQMFKDMDEWGYTFRLGSAQKWFEHDADDAQQWLQRQHIISLKNECLFQLNQNVKN